MISFIVIGKNIEKTISLCVSSIYSYTEFNKIENFEIIYVDSDSNDDSVNIANQYNIKIVVLKGQLNAAIGRNVGARNATADVLFFIDGDMELFPDVFDDIFDSFHEKLKYPFVRGYQKHYYYDEAFNFKYSVEEKLPEKPVYKNKTGGLMIVEKRLWKQAGGFDERLIRNEDVDFGLRMSAMGYPILYINKYIVKHHTISYYNRVKYSYFFKTLALLSTGILMRKHLFNLVYIKIYYRNMLYVLAVLLMITIFFISNKISLLLLLGYLLIHFIRAIKKSKQGMFASFIFMVLINIYTLAGLFYFPAKPIYSIEELKKNS